LGGTNGLKIRFDDTNPAWVHVLDAAVLWALISDGTVQIAAGVAVGTGVGVGVGVGAGVGVADGFGVGVGPGVGEGVGDGVGLGDGEGVTSGMSSIVPLRIGNAEDALTVRVLPSRLLITGVIKEKPQVIETTAGEPIPVPLGKLGTGIGDWSAQFTCAASFRTRFE
jgi:hypothetical protein